MSKLYPVHLTAEEVDIICDALVSYIALRKGIDDERDEIALQAAHKVQVTNEYAQIIEEQEG